MAAADKLGAIVSCASFNKDATQVCLALGGEEAYIYNCKPSADDSSKGWEKKYTLKEHGGYISGIDWCHQTNLIATCGHDRNAYVWKFDEKERTWKPTLVILRINRAATSVKWSPLGNKFAVASGAKSVPVCSYEKSNDWWISKMLKKHKSTVFSLAWCCNNKFLVTGCADNKCRVFSAYIDGLDAAEDDGFGELWPQQHSFGEVLAEFDCGGWVNAVAWSPSGFRIAFAGHDSTVNTVQIVAGAKPILHTLCHKSLPFVSLEFLNDNSLLAGGFDCTPTLFTVQGGDESEPIWKFKETFDKPPVTTGTSPRSAAVGASAGRGTTGSPAKGAISTGSTTASARAMFANMASKGTVAPGSSSGASKPSVLSDKPALITRHTNDMTTMCVLKKGDDVDKIATGSLDGRVLYWDLAKLKIALK